MSAICLSARQAEPTATTATEKYILITQMLQMLRKLKAN